MNDALNNSTNINSDININRGLTDSEVSIRVANGQVNGKYLVKTKSIGKIFSDNIFTLFNAINLFLAICVVMVHSYKNALFMGVVFWNILIGIIQEIRSKKVIDRLSILAEPKVLVLRNGQEKIVSLEEIVIDEIIILKNGNQIPADAMIVEGRCQVNESLLTGESEPVYKKEGDEILSGSFIVSGSIKAKVIHIGGENYANKIVGKAKYIKAVNSTMLKSVKLIIKFVTIALAPIAALLFINQLHMGRNFDEAVVATVAAVIGMIPSGLILLISVVLAVSVVKLGRQKVLVQEMFCIENLARVDVLCLDKTGTLTEGAMVVEELLLASGLGMNDYIDTGYTSDEIVGLLSAYTSVLDDNNPTFEAVQKYAEKYSGFRDKYVAISKEGFSSAKKRSSVTFDEEGTFYLGAYEFITSETDKNIQKKIDEYSKMGYRVLTFARESKVIALIIISDKVRDTAKETLTYFRNQGVAIKIISGDNPITVANVAKKAGLTDADNYIDASLLASEEEVKNAALKYSVFGRVTPNQKLIIINALKEDGHCVAMTGDGVNDVMALKEADCSIAMESGSDAARNVSQIVLLDSDFAHMPDIVAEGRRTINNLQRSAALYLSKTVYSTILAVLFVFIPISYPFQPIQLTLIGALSIGLPSLILALEPNYNRVRGNFLTNIFRMAIPGGAIVLTNIIFAELAGYFIGANTDQISTISVYGLAIASAIHLHKVCKPFNITRGVMYITFVSIFLGISLFMKSFFGLSTINYYHWIALIIMASMSFVIYQMYYYIVEKVTIKYCKN